MDDYFTGCDVLGAGIQLPGVPVQQGPYVTIHVNNIPDLVKQQGGGAGAFALNFVPKTIESTVYGKIAEEVSRGFKDKGVNAEVKVVQNAPPGGPFKRDFLTGVGVGAATFGLGFGIVKLIKHLRSRR